MPSASLPVDVAGLTHVGGRDENQDRFAIVGTHLAILSDGMGGHAGGARAAQLTVDAVIDRLGEVNRPDEAALNDAFVEANDRVRVEREASVDEKRMGATLTVAVPMNNRGDEWLVGHVGDSPAFRVTHTSIERLTDDHTVAGELVRQGAISEAAAEEHPQRNVLLRAIGAEEEVDPEARRVPLDPGDSLVLVSDGVTGVVSITDIRDLVRTAPSAEAAAEALVTTAVEQDATDNVTAVVVRRLEQEETAVKVMIATDGSDAAIEASERAVRLLRDDAEIILLTVIPEQEDPMETAGGIEGPALTEEEAEREFHEHLETGQQALTKTSRSLGKDVEVRLVPVETEPGHAIVAIAEESQPDLIVIGASGKSLLRRLFTGSISDYVVHHAPCPVLVIRHDH